MKQVIVPFLRSLRAKREMMMVEKWAQKPQTSENKSRPGISWIDRKHIINISTPWSQKWVELSNDTSCFIFLNKQWLRIKRRLNTHKPKDVWSIKWSQVHVLHMKYFSCHPTAVCINSWLTQCVCNDQKNTQNNNNKKHKTSFLSFSLPILNCFYTSIAVRNTLERTADRI